MNRLADTAALSVAVLQLKLVQSVIGAIKAADANSRAERAGDSDSIAPAIEPRRRFHPDAVYEPRKHVHPSPVYHPGHHREASAWRQCWPPACDLEPIKPAIAHAPGHRIEPPWNILPWPQPLPPRQPVKVHRCRSDVTGKGATLDIFL